VVGPTTRAVVLPLIGGLHCGEQFAVNKTELGGHIIPSFIGGLHCSDGW
jgi:hypothetical protein